MEIAGSVAVVTGASSGIGRQAALDLAGAGARVVAVARRRERLDELVSELERRGTPGSALVCDVADPDQVAATAGRVLEAHGAADILVCAAGVPLHRAFADTPVADLDRVMRVNYLGTAAWIGALLPAMRRRRRGYVVCVASIAGAVPWAWEAGYSASKAAVVALCEAIAPELRRHGIGIGWVSPGLVRTELFDELALAHVPPAVRRTWMEPGVVSAAIVETVARERRGTTLPRVLGIPPILRQLLPGPFRAGVERTYRRSLVRPGPPA